MSADPATLDAPAQENSIASAAAPPVERPIPRFTRLRIWIVRQFLDRWTRLLGLRGLYLFGRAFGTIEYFVDYRRRGRVHRKLRSMFKDEHNAAWYRKHVRQYFMRVRCDKMFYTIMDRIPREKLMKRIKLTGRRHLEAAQTRGKGLYIAMCHYGSFHVAGLLGALLGFELMGVRDPKESAVRRYIQEKYRQTFPEFSRIKLFYSGQFPREIYRNLQHGRIIASTIDIDRHRGERLKTHPVHFFGEMREFLIGPVQMAVRCESTIVQTFVVSRKNFYYQLVISPPLIEPGPAADEPAHVAVIMQRYANGVEAFARTHPDHVMNI